MTQIEEFELEALRYAGLPEMPEEAGPDTPVWIYAVAKLVMTTLSKGYAIVRNEYNGAPHMMKVFGTGAIARIESIHPYKFLDKKYVPTFKTEKQTKDFLAEVYGVERSSLNGLKKDTIAAMLYVYCMKKQLADESRPVYEREEPKQEEYEEESASS